MNLLSLFDLEISDLDEILQNAIALKATPLDWNRPPKYAGSVMGLLFEKSSLRTRVSFEAAIAHFGGSAIFLGQEAGWGKRETIADFGRVLSQYLDVLVFRGKDHTQLVELAGHCSCPVINGLTDIYHPCQALADILTIRENTTDLDRPIRVAYVGDCNNVSRSLAICCAMMGIELRIGCPEGYQFSPDFAAGLSSKIPNATLPEITSDPKAAVENADAVYTDVWTSMGQEKEEKQRRNDFASFQVNAELMSLASPNASFLHCLPAKRGVEVTDEVLDGPQSAVVQQAGNRMHAQKAVLDFLLTKATVA